MFHGHEIRPSSQDLKMKQRFSKISIPKSFCRRRSTKFSYHSARYSKQNAMRGRREKNHTARPAETAGILPRTPSTLFSFPSTVHGKKLRAGREVIRIFLPPLDGLRGKGKGGRVREGGKNFWGPIWFSRPPALHFVFVLDRAPNCYRNSKSLGRQRWRRSRTVG
jgi:hypothetical protein